MSTRVPCDDEQDDEECCAHIKDYMLRFRAQVLEVRHDGKLDWKKSRNFKLLKKLGNPRILRVYDAWKDKESGVWKVNFQLWNTPAYLILELDEARKESQAMVAFYGNFLEYSLRYKQWEWAADEQVCPLVEDDLM